jgi:hypothetical protein
MTRHIKLTEDMVSMLEPQFTPELMREAIANMVKRGLRFDNATGKVRDNDGLLVEYVRQSDFVPHTCVEDVVRWEFNGIVNNEAWHGVIRRCGGDVDAAIHAKSKFRV